MLMHRSMQGDHNEEREDFFWHNEKLRSVEPFRPLSERLDKEFAIGMKNLKEVLPASDFENYIESIVSLKIIGSSLWLITDRPMHRTLLKHRFIPAFKEAFEVEDVRIISQI